MRTDVCPLSILSPLRLDPRLEGTQEGCDHVEAVVFYHVLAGALLDLILALEGGEIAELVPVDFLCMLAVHHQGQGIVAYRNLLPCARLKVRVHRHTAKDVQKHALFAHVDGDALHLAFGLHQASFLQIVTRLLVDLAYGAFQIRLVLVDFSSRETPLGALLPTLYQNRMGHVVVEHDGASHGDACLVLQEVLEGFEEMVLREASKERTMLEHALGEHAQVHRRQARVQRPDEVFIEPLCLLDLKADALDRLQLLVGQVHNEAHAEVIEPVKQALVGGCHGKVGQCRAACLGAARAGEVCGELRRSSWAQNNDGICGCLLVRETLARTSACGATG